MLQVETVASEKQSWSILSEKKQTVHGLWHSAGFSRGRNLWEECPWGELSMGYVQKKIPGEWSAGIVWRELSRQRGLGNGWVLSGQIFRGNVCRELSGKCPGEMFRMPCRTRSLNVWQLWFMAPELTHRLTHTEMASDLTWAKQMPVCQQVNWMK